MEAKKVIKTQEKPRRQNKLGEWLDAHPGPLIEVLDWRAVNK